MTDRKAIDWERIEADYRSGILSLREIASAHAVSHTAIRKRAERDGWVRDLAAKIKAKAEELVSKQAVSSEVSKQALATERQIVEANAAQAAAVQVSQRASIQRASETLTSVRERIEVEGTELPLEKHVAVAKTYMDALKTLVGMQREAYGMASMPEGQSNTYERIERIIVRPSNSNA